MSLTLSDIKLEYDYVGFRNYVSALSHDIKRMGVVDFVKENSSSIERVDIAKLDDLGFIKHCYLIALLEYLSKELHYDESIKLDKYIVDLRDYFVEIDDDEDLSRVDARLKIAIPEFLRRGFIYSEVDIAL